MRQCFPPNQRVFKQRQLHWDERDDNIICNLRQCHLTADIISMGDSLLTHARKSLLIAFACQGPMCRDNCPLHILNSYITSGPTELRTYEGW